MAQGRDPVASALQFYKGKEIFVTEEYYSDQVIVSQVDFNSFLVLQSEKK